ncbi:MAG: hypothetical protein Q8O67_18020 [Deltaproteobacteria bacterium]|nr:hypothetical protein [Deltaproteobacteria bacterium]
MIRRAAAVVVVVVCAACAPIAPSRSCVTYVACERAYDEAAGLEPVDVGAYEPGGACWANEDFADDCTAECQDAIESLAASSAAADLNVVECEAG